MKLQPILIIVAGLILIFLGFVYDVVFAGIPYQDPTPEMNANYAFHSRIASVVEWAGTLLFLFGCGAGMIAILIRRRKSLKS